MTPSEYINQLKAAKTVAGSELQKLLVFASLEPSFDRVARQMSYPELHECRTIAAELEELARKVCGIFMGIDFSAVREMNRGDRDKTEMRAKTTTISEQDKAMKTLQAAGIPKELITALLAAKKK